MKIGQAVKDNTSPCHDIVKPEDKYRPRPPYPDDDSMPDAYMWWKYAKGALYVSLENFVKLLPPEEPEYGYDYDQPGPSPDQCPTPDMLPQ